MPGNQGFELNDVIQFNTTTQQYEIINPRFLQVSREITKISGETILLVAKMFGDATRVYSPLAFGAITYEKQTPALIIPVIYASLVPAVHALIKQLKKYDADNPVINKLDAAIANLEKGISIIGNIGFNVNMLNIIVSLFDGNLSLHYQTIIIPAMYCAASLLAAINYKGREMGHVPSPFFRHINRTITGASGGSFLAPFVQYDYVNPLPSTILMMTLAISGLMSSLIKEKYQKTSFYMMLLINAFFNNATLSVAGFNLLISFYVSMAEKNQGEDFDGVPDGIFFGTLGFVGAMYLGLVSMSPRNPPTPAASPRIEIIEDEDVVRDISPV